MPSTSGERFPSRYTNLDRARVVHGDRVDRVGAYLWKADPLADDAAAALAELPRARGQALLDEGLAHGTKAIVDAPAALRALVESAEDVPAWVDWAACDRGGALLMRAGMLGGAVLGTRSLVLGYASPGGNKPLVLSGRLTEQATRRLDETSRFVQAVSRPGGMRPYADGWRITLKVRMIHAQVRRMILGRGDAWDAAAYGAPINQHDMAGTTLLFGVVLVDGLRKLGMDVSLEQSECYAHLWRWVGRVIGVDDGILPASETDGTKLADLIALTMGAPDDDSRALTKALFDAATERAHTPAEHRAASRRVAFGHLLCRELVGDALADGLGVPRTPYRHALPLLRRFVRSTSGISRRIPFAERRAEAAGARYWDQVVAGGLAASYDFPLPERLAHA